MTGGAIGKHQYMPMSTQAVSAGENQKVLCKLAIREDWLCKAICGNKHRNVDVATCRLTLLQDLHAVAKRTWDRRMSEAAPAVADAAADEAGPMNEIAG